jgi:hypothetical protein
MVSLLVLMVGAETEMNGNSAATIILPHLGRNVKYFFGNL